jgi:predicted RNase H-like HicB family nuclease
LVNQLTGTYKVKSPDLAPLHQEALRQLGTFSEWSTRHVPRGENAAADALANQALDHALSNSELEFSVILTQEGRAFVARVPAFPRVEGRGTTKSAALEDVRSGVLEAVQELRRQGRSIPREERIRIRVAPELR